MSAPTAARALDGVLAGLWTALLTQVLTRVRNRLPERIEHDRGDVPGWVLVTIMTAGLVAGLWAVAGDALNDLFLDSIRGVAP